MKQEEFNLEAFMQEAKEKLIEEINLYETACLDNFKKGSIQKNNVIKYFETANTKLVNAYKILRKHDSLNEKKIENLVTDMKTIIK